MVFPPWDTITDTEESDKNFVVHFQNFDCHAGFLNIKESICDAIRNGYFKGVYSMDYFHAVMITLFSFSLHLVDETMTVAQYCRAIKAFNQYHEFINNDK